MATDQDWQRTLVTWLHDPPDKALDVRTHESRARQYLKAALDREIDQSEIKGLPDQIASAFERLPLPMHEAERSPDRSKGIRSVHPLSGSERTSDVTIDPDRITQDIRSIVDGLDTNQQRFLALWRCLPEKLGPLSQLPADTRIPDHTIIQHMDTTAGVLNAQTGQIALLSFKLSPVQSFIEAARSTRDLLTGSYILAWLVFYAMKPLLEELGPTALIYPALRGSPLMDAWLRKKHGLAGKIKAPTAELLTSASLPNRFLAVVPYSNAAALASQAEESCRQAWLDLAGDVHAYLRKYWSSYEWDHLWQSQIDSFFSMRTAFVRQSECSFEHAAECFTDAEHKQWFQDMKAVLDLREAIPRGDRYNASASARENAPGQWQVALTFSAALMNCATEIRHIPNYHVNGIVPGKCSLMGTYEQMGPAELSRSDEFWAGHQSASEEEETASSTGIPEGRIKTGERLCAISLVKRFAFEASLCDRLGIPLRDVHFEDTRQIAKRGESSGQAAPSYYAALMLDGDELGKWLDGRNSPAIRKVYDPKLARYFENLPETETGLDARRPVGPALHAAISEALGNFSLHLAPAIVEQHHGTLIYAGGDDVLALLPVSRALSCALELRRAYSGSPKANQGADPGFYRYRNSDVLTMGPTATASAGIAVAHYKEDMRLVLAAARRAERRAKNAGRNGLGLTIMRRSGEHSESHCTWDAVEPLQNLVELNLKGASDRWAYHLRGQLDVLEALNDRAAQEREIRRLLARSEGSISISFDKLQGLWDAVHEPNPKTQKPPEAPLNNFTILCQSASFLARGRDDR